MILHWKYPLLALGLCLVIEYPNLVIGSVCIPTLHPVIQYEDTSSAYKRTEFKADTSGDYSSLLYDTKNKALFVGGRNYLFQLNPSTLLKEKEIPWKTENKRECTGDSKVDKGDCENYVQFLAKFDDKIIACGTNSLSPVYYISSEADASQKIYTNSVKGWCAAPKPGLKMVGSITEQGELFAGTYNDYEGKEAVIVGTYMEENRPSGVQLTYQRWRTKILHDPEFVASVDIGDAVLIFYNDQAEELDFKRRPTVVRLCKSDNGAPSHIKRELWTTFRKARINCKIDSQKDLDYSIIKHMVHDKKSGLFYGTFTTSRDTVLSSAVCAFQLSDFIKTFDGPFLAKKNSGKWEPISNGNFLTQCEVNKAKLITQSIPPGSIPEGKQPTNFMDMDVIEIALNNQLMAGVISNDASKSSFNLPLARFTQIAVDTIKGTTSRHDLHTLYIATESGKILVVFENESVKKACLVEEIRLDESDQAVKINQLLISNKERRLYVATNHKVVGLNLDGGCHRFTSRDACLDANDPRCVWNTTGKGECVPSFNRRGAQNALQDFSKCPRREEQWSKWSKWKICNQSGRDEEYCLCRKRSCLSCNLHQCDVSKAIEIKNCTVNPVGEGMKESWMKEGVRHGQWGEWGDWSQCGDDDETQHRTRKCSHPEPKNGGHLCYGSSKETKICPRKPILYITIWGAWSEWSECRSFENGQNHLRVRNRICSLPDGCKGPINETKHCAPSGVIWGNWSMCNCVQHLRHRIPKDTPACNATNQWTCTALVQYSNCTCTKNESNEVEEAIKELLIKGPTEPAPRRLDDGVNLQIHDIVIAAIALLVTCFIVCFVVICLFLKRQKRELKVQKREEGSGISPDLLKTPLRRDQQLNNASNSKRNSKRLSGGSNPIDLDRESPKNFRTNLDSPLLHDATKI